MIAASVESRTVKECVVRIPDWVAFDLHEQLSTLLAWNEVGGEPTYCPLVVELCDAIGRAEEVDE